MCGPSNSQQQIAKGQQNFFNTLQQSYEQNFGQQQGILSSLRDALSPIIQGGPNQPGYSAGTVADLRGNAINNAAAANRNAQVIAGSSAGGNTGVTTGGQKQLQAQIASTTGGALQNDLTNIDLSNYAAGRQNFYNAESGLAGAASLYNPTGYAGQATGAGNAAFGSATEVQNMKNQEQADIGGAVAGLALAPFTGGMSLGGLKGLLGGGGGGGEDFYGNQG